MINLILPSTEDGVFTKLDNIRDAIFLAGPCPRENYDNDDFLEYYISNAHDIDIFFADPGCPGQRGLNEHSNGLLRRNGLPKQMDFTNISQKYLSAIADKRNRIPRKSLNYQTPYQVFLSYLKSLT